MRYLQRSYNVDVEQGVGSVKPRAAQSVPVGPLCLLLGVCSTTPRWTKPPVGGSEHGCQTPCRMAGEDARHWHVALRDRSLGAGGPVRPFAPGTLTVTAPGPSLARTNGIPCRSWPRAGVDAHLTFLPCWRGEGYGPTTWSACPWVSTACATGDGNTATVLPRLPGRVARSRCNDHRPPAATFPLLRATRVPAASPVAGVGRASGRPPRMRPRPTCVCGEGMGLSGLPSRKRLLVGRSASRSDRSILIRGR